MASRCQTQEFTGLRRHSGDFPPPCLGHFLAFVRGVCWFSPLFPVSCSFAGLSVLQTSMRANNFCKRQSRWSSSHALRHIPRLGLLTHPILEWCCLPYHPNTSVPAGCREAPRSHQPGQPVVMTHVSLVGSRLQPRAGEKCKFGVGQCFPMVTELKPDKFPW